jgi:hypothetical protein
MLDRLAFELRRNRTLRAQIDRRNGALLHGLGCARIECARSPTSSDADGLWAAKLKHAVQHMNGEGDLCRTTPGGLRAQRIPNHSFEAADGGLH